MLRALVKAGKAGGRMAGSQLAQVMSHNPVPGMTLGQVTKREWLDRLWMDGMFGTVQGFTTPGSLDEKIATGIAATVGGGMGGATLATIPGLRRGGGRQLAEFAGGWGGDMVGTSVAEAGIRAKDVVLGGTGQTGWEKLAAEDQRLMEQQILAAHGLGPYQPTDMFMAQNGLG